MLNSYEVFARGKSRAGRVRVCPQEKMKMSD